MTARALNHGAHPGRPRAEAATPAPRAEAAPPAPPPTDPHALARVLMHSDVDVDAELATLYARPAWHAEAACRGTHVDEWYPGRAAGRPSPDLLARCATCPVRTPCAEAGTSERYGWWAGRPAPRSRRTRKAATQP